MNPELRHFLTEGPTTVKELARLTGKSTSTIYKALNDAEAGVQSTKTEGEAARYFIVAEKQQGSAGATTEALNDLSPPPLAADSPAQPSAVGKRGRKATATGQKLTAVGTENKRRAGSHGYRSLQIIIDNPGITTEDYLAQGGRLNDLRWDIAHGNVNVEAAS